jgi:hypothetical protein
VKVIFQNPSFNGFPVIEMLQPNDASGFGTEKNLTVNLTPMFTALKSPAISGLQTGHRS